MHHERSVQVLDQEFKTAAERVLRSNIKVDNQTRLDLYALYKQATVGPCNVSRPMYLDFAGRAKWDSWNALDDVSTDQAKQRYVSLAMKVLNGMESVESSKAGGDMGVGLTSGVLAATVSRMVFQPEDCDMNSIWDLACDNEIDRLTKLLDTRIVPVDARDENGCSVLHLACDRGHNKLVELLLGGYHANPNLQDNSGCTPLHYAVCCNRPDIAQILLSYGASRFIKDNEGHLPASNAGEVAAVLRCYGN